jgi:tRNA dimethylallyltransferase
MLTAPALVTIGGPTATGKTGLAIQLAERLGSAVLGADSRQIYRELDVATAKPTPAELATVPHYLINTCEPSTVLTVADYQTFATGLIQNLHQRHRIPLLVGGTGLYIKSIVRGLKIPRVSPQEDLRAQLSSYDLTTLYQMLQQVDPASKIHPNDQTRILRALEVYYVTGQPISSQQGEQPPSYPIVQIGLDCPNLEARIRQRTAGMLELGWEQEVRDLIVKYGADFPQLQTLGYREMARYIQGELTLPEAIEATILATKQLAKRQRTWFRAVPEIIWFDSTDPNLLDRVWELLQQSGST